MSSSSLSFTISLRSSSILLAAIFLAKEPSFDAAISFSSALMFSCLREIWSTKSPAISCAESAEIREFTALAIAVKASTVFTAAGKKMLPRVWETISQLSFIVEMAPLSVFDCFSRPPKAKPPSSDKEAKAFSNTSKSTLPLETRSRTAFSPTPRDFANAGPILIPLSCNWSSLSPVSFPAAETCP